MRPLGELQLGQHRVQHQWRACAQERHHLPPEGVAEVCSRRPPVGQAPPPLAEALVREARGERREEALDLRPDPAATDRGERRGIVSERKIEQAVRAEEGGGGDLRPVVVLGRHPEERDRGAPLGFERLGIAHRRSGLDQSEQRPAEEAGLLPADHHRGRRVGELRRELGGARVAVAGIGACETGRDPAAVDGRRRHLGQRPRRQQAQRCEEVGLLAGEPGSGHPLHQAVGNKIDFEGSGGHSEHPSGPRGWQGRRRPELDIEHHQRKPAGARRNPLRAVAGGPTLKRRNPDETWGPDRAQGISSGPGRRRTREMRISSSPGRLTWSRAPAKLGPAVE